MQILSRIGEFIFAGPLLRRPEACPDDRIQPVPDDGKPTETRAWTHFCEFAPKGVIVHCFSGSIGWGSYLDVTEEYEGPWMRPKLTTSTNLIGTDAAAQVPDIQVPNDHFPGECPWCLTSLFNADGSPRS